MNRIRLADSADAEGILAIYAPIVRETIISFEVEPPMVNEMRGRVEATLTVLPWLVAESEAGIDGYAYASRHRERAAYQWSVDVSAYVAEAARRRGVARSLYTPLLGILGDLGYYSAFAGIALPNPASVALHESLGFHQIGIYRKVGYKLGAWHDVGWWQRELREYGANPTPPRSMTEYLNSSQLRNRLSGAGPR
jgi:L-amino acid N-acyltransferase YncA